MLSEKVKQNRVLVNSLPKSGTHLLARTIAAFGYQEYMDSTVYEWKNPRFFSAREVKRALGEKGRAENERDLGEKVEIGPIATYSLTRSTFRKWLEVLPMGHYMFSHIPWGKAISPTLIEADYSHFFIIRDPRAVLASRLRFILDPGKARELYKDGKHFLEADLKAMTSAQQLEFLLYGGYAPKANLEIKGYAEAYRSTLAWRNDPNCLFMRFEDLVGDRGGGSDEQQWQLIAEISSHLGMVIDDEIKQNLTKIYDPSARTFKSGKIDGWKQSLDSESIELVMDYCSPLCEEAGYAP